MPLLRTNRDLLEGFREGRPESLERVYWAYVRRVDVQVRYLARASKAAELAQPSSVSDLIQEVFTRAFSASARRSYDASRDFGPYLSSIARNCLIDALRARGREVLLTPEDLRDLHAPLEPVETVYDSKVVRVLQEYLAALPHALQGVYRERFVFGKSQLEACGALGLSRRTLRTREEHLRTGLRKALQARGILVAEASSRWPPSKTEDLQPPFAGQRGRLGSP